MSLTNSKNGANGVLGSHNTTRPKASKIDRIIGYLMRKRKKQQPAIAVTTSTQDEDVIMYSRHACHALEKDCIGKGRDELYKMPLDDQNMMCLEENHMQDGKIVGLGGTMKNLKQQHVDGKPPLLPVAGAETKVFIKMPKKKKLTPTNKTSAEVSCQANESVEIECKIPEFEKQIESLPRRLIAKLKARPNTRFVYSQLLNFLRCKHFMHVRDSHFITTLVADARAWLLKNNYTMENAIEYSILASAVQQAFAISAEELAFRAFVKKPQVIDHIEHLNATMSGDLGRVFMFSNGGNILSKVARRPFMRHLQLAPKTEHLV